MVAGWFMPFRYLVFSTCVMARQKDGKKTPREKTIKTKQRHAKRRNHKIRHAKRRKTCAKDELESRVSYMSPGKTEVKQGKVVFISRAKGYFRETYKSQYINPISPTPKFTVGIIQIKVKSLSTSFQCSVQ